MRFEGKSVLITGAAGGIGRAIAEAFRAEGARVAVTDRETAALEADAHLPGDLTDREFCDALPEAARSALGALDIVINNAGIITRGKLPEATDADIALTLEVNVEAPIRICRAAIPIMAAAGGGAIVNTASCWGLHPGPNHPLYVMSKAALASLTQCLGRDHASDGIRINAVCPNEVNTPMIRTGFETRGLDPDHGIAELNQSVPLGRIAEPEDIADVITFLAR
ncbi:MAG: SDR family oxidoreductase [Pseudomonadota bacterium]